MRRRSTYISSTKASFARPFVYGFDYKLNRENLKREYTPNPTKVQPIRWFCQGDPYEFWGVVKGSWHIMCPAEKGTLFLLGTDRLGRDVLSRIIYGARISLTIGLLGVGVSLILGIVIGGMAGYYGGLFDVLSQRLIEVIQSIPSIPLWLALAAILPITWSPIVVYFGITVILGLLDWTGLARTVRSKLFALREEDYVSAAQVMGAVELQDCLAPSDSRVRLASYRHRHDCHPFHDPRRDDVELPGSRLACADHQLGRAADRGPEHQRGRPLPVAAMARASRDPRRAGFQFLRRRAQRRGRPLQVTAPALSGDRRFDDSRSRRVILIYFEAGGRR